MLLDAHLHDMAGNPLPDHQMKLMAGEKADGLAIVLCTPAALETLLHLSDPPTGPYGPVKLVLATEGNTFAGTPVTLTVMRYDMLSYPPGTI